ncbi:ATP-binding protein [Planctomycetota bacterium]
MIDTTEIQAVIRGFNPWWMNKPLDIPDFRRLGFFACRQLLHTSGLKRAILLSGPRRVGKTTVLEQLAASLLEDDQALPASILYLSLDHPLLKLMSLARILKMYHETVHPAGQPTTLLLDEIQYAGDWDLELKQLVDHHPEYRIIATGSATVLHKDKLSESGVGRWITVPMPTLNFYEFVQIRNESPDLSGPAPKPSDLLHAGAHDLANLAERLRPLMPAFQRYLLVGGFPETARAQDLALSQRILREDVVERVLKRDMTAIFGIRRVAELEKLFIYLCLHSGDIFSPKTCADVLEVGSPQTVRNHLGFLEQAHLIYRLDPEKLSGKAVLRSRPKIYLADAALGNAVLLRSEEILSDTDQMGKIVETTVLRHLYAYYYRDTPRIGYWRDNKTDKEVDIIVRSPAYTLPVEVKYRSKADIPVNCGMATFCKAEPVKQAFWITQRPEDFDVQKVPGCDTPILRIPAYIFCYLLGQAERSLWDGVE